ncbi:hypothetical protein KKC17_01120 [Patescibacteria group bacterium]|nr:hypothetical protein [Patescibacteria group bacterium]
MIKAIIFDWFGVCTTENWADCLARELSAKLKIDDGVIRSEFKKVLQPFAAAELTDREFLQKFLATLDPNGQVDDYLYLFNTIPQVNWSVLQLAGELKKKYKVYLLSNNFGPVFPNYQIKVNFREYFNELFLSHQLKVSKTNPKVWDLVLAKIPFLPAEILFIDNKQKYLALATERGLSTILFKDAQQLREAINSLSLITP